jgi:hypothetical protein
MRDFDNLKLETGITIMCFYCFSLFALVLYYRARVSIYCARVSIFKNPCNPRGHENTHPRQRTSGRPGRNEFVPKLGDEILEVHIFCGRAARSFRVCGIWCSGPATSHRTTSSREICSLDNFITEERCIAARITVTRRTRCAPGPCDASRTACMPRAYWACATNVW